MQDGSQMRALRHAHAQSVMTQTTLKARSRGYFPLHLDADFQAEERF